MLLEEQKRGADRRDKHHMLTSITMDVFIAVDDAFGAHIEGTDVFYMQEDVSYSL